MSLKESENYEDSLLKKFSECLKPREDFLNELNIDKTEKPEQVTDVKLPPAGNKSQSFFTPRKTSPRRKFSENLIDRFRKAQANMEK